MNRPLPRSTVLTVSDVVSLCGAAPHRALAGAVLVALLPILATCGKSEPPAPPAGSAAKNATPTAPQPTPTPSQSETAAPAEPPSAQSAPAAPPIAEPTPKAVEPSKAAPATGAASKRSAAAPSKPAVAQPPAANQKTAQAPGQYTVVKGDTLYSIARKHRVNVRDLAKWNDIKDPAQIRVGLQLRLSAPGA
jgi:LysM repeat protein